MTDLGTFLKEARGTRKLSRRGLGRISGVSHAEIGRIETGVRKQPSPRNLRALAAALGVSHEELMILAGHIDRPVSRTVIKGFWGIFKKS